MVARRRLKRPPRRSAHLSKNRVHVKLAEAGIDRVAGKVDQDVQDMRDQIEQDDNRRNDGERSPEEHPEEAEESSGEEGSPPEGTKVAG